MANLDERLQALTESLELMQHESQEQRNRLERQEERERRARLALLEGIRAYLAALGNGHSE